MVQRILRIVLPAIVAVFAGLVGIAAADDPERARVMRLVAQADDLLSRAQAIAANTPRTRLAAAEIASPSGAGGRFYRDERRFQDATRGGPVLTQVKSDSLRLAEMNLTTVDSFLYGAVVASLSCNAHDAALNLRVARAFIAEIHRDVAGRGSANWSPPEITEDGRVLCQ